MVFGPLQRRRFLRGGAAAIALPWMESLRPLHGREPELAASPPIRSMFCFFGNGVHPQAWYPKQGGSTFELPPSLQPLRKLKSKIIVVDGVKNDGMGKTGHSAAASQWTCMPWTNRGGFTNGGPSVDQLLGAHIGAETPLLTLDLSTDPPPSSSQLHFHYLSWRSATKPVAREIDPKTVFERMFGAKDAQGKPLPQRSAEDDRSLLDLVLDDAKSLQKHLSKMDRSKVEEYLDAIRGVERRIEFSSKEDKRVWRPPTRPPQLLPPGVPRNPGQRMRMLSDLAVLALWTDTTRVVSFMFANESINRNFNPYMDGLSVAAHHTNSHHSGSQDMIQNYIRITEHFVKEYAYICQRLDAINEGERSLLDNSMIHLSNSMDDGNAHSSGRMPTILAGSAGGRMTTGRCLQYPKGTPVSSLYLTMLHNAGVAVDSFARARHELPGLNNGQPAAVPGWDDEPQDKRRKRLQAKQKTKTGQKP